MWKISYKLTKQFKNPEFKGPLRVAVNIKSRLEKFRANINLIQVVCNPGLKTRHWNQLSQVLNTDIRPNEASTLKDLLKFNNLIEKNLSVITEISSLASKEYTLEQALEKMKSEWENVILMFKPYKNTNTFILTSHEDILALLDDHLIKTATIKNSPFLKPLETETITWLNKLVFKIFF